MSPSLVHQSSRGRPAAAFLYAMAFCSGAAALIYELTWAKMLSLTFGSTTLSAAAVIAGFMGGMGLGARYFHLLGDRVRKPLIAYALLELGIAASAAALTPVFYELPEVFAAISATLPSPVLYRAVQILAVFLLVLIPSVMMGATFPALCSVMIKTVGTLDRRLGLIYGINTIGGAAGVLLGGLLLIEQLGLSRTVYAANVLNIAVAASALLMLSRWESAGGEGEAAHGETAIPTELPRSLTGAVLLISGFTTLAYEILWFRALRFIVGNSTHALGTILIIFLLGLGAGSLLLRWAVQKRPAERSLAYCQIGIAVLALWAMVFEAFILADPDVQHYVSIFLPEVRLQSWAWRLAIICGVSLVMMLPGTLLMGLSFPLATRLFLGDLRHLGTRVGTAYLLANIGSILGAVLAATLLVPAFGPTTGTKLLACVNLLLGIFILVQLKGVRLAWAVPPVALAVVFAAMLPKSLALVGEGAPGEIVFAKDADQGTVHVFAEPNDPTQMVMLVDGCKIGCAFGYRTTPMFLKQTVLAHLPIVLDPAIRRTLNVGLGSGSTLHTLAGYRELESLDCVEINPAVVEGSMLFPEAEVYDDPRVRVVVDDAISLLLRSPGSYDLIISDGKQDPFFSGNAALLSREYYDFANKSLRPGGLFVQWISLATLHEDFRIILRTLLEVFAEVEVFVFAPDNAFMVASDRPIFGRAGELKAEAGAALVGPGAAGLGGREGSERATTGGPDPYAQLARFGVSGRAALLARWVGGRAQLENSLSEAAVSTWDHLVLDYSPFKADPQRWSASNLENLRLLSGHADVGSRWAAPAELDPQVNLYVASQFELRRAYVASLSGDAPEALRLSQLAQQAHPVDLSVRQAQAYFSQMLQQSGRP